MTYEELQIALKKANIDFSMKDGIPFIKDNERMKYIISKVCDIPILTDDVLAKTYRLHHNRHILDHMQPVLLQESDNDCAKYELQWQTCFMHVISNKIDNDYYIDREMQHLNLLINLSNSSQ